MTKKPRDVPAASTFECFSLLFVFVFLVFFLLVIVVSLGGCEGIDGLLRIDLTVLEGQPFRLTRVSG